MKKFFGAINLATLIIMAYFCIRSFINGFYYNVIILIMFYLGYTIWKAYFKKEDVDDIEDLPQDETPKTKIIFIKNGYNAYFKTSKKHKNRGAGKQIKLYKK